MTDRTESLDDLVREADAMLYLAKEYGRNQTWVLREDGLGHAATPGIDVPPVQPTGIKPSAGIRSGSRVDRVKSAHAHSHNE